MDTTKRHDWGLIVAGILLVVCAFFFLVAPGLTLVTITAIAGAAFLVSGVFDIINYVRFHKVMNLSGWAIAYAVLDIVIGLMFLIHPLALAGVIPWMIGAFFIIFGVFEIVGSFTVKKTTCPCELDAVLGGIVSVLCGLAISSALRSSSRCVHTHARRVTRILVGTRTRPCWRSRAQALPQPPLVAMGRVRCPPLSW